MRGVYLFLQIAAILLAQSRSETFRWDLWHRQTPGSNIAEIPLPDQDKAAIKATVIEILTRDEELTGSAPAGRLSHQELQEMAQLTQVKLMDVTGDGIPEVIAEGRDQSGYLCSPTGNCPLWVLKKQGSRYRAILESFGNGLSTDCRQRQRPCEIAVFMHGDATSFSIERYRLSNLKYRKAAEYQVVWPLDENGTTAAKPTVTKVR